MLGRGSGLLGMSYGLLGSQAGVAECSAEPEVLRKMLGRVARAGECLAGAAEYLAWPAGCLASKAAECWAGVAECSATGGKMLGTIDLFYILQFLS